MTDETRVGSPATGPAEPDTTATAVDTDQVTRPGTAPDTTGPDGAVDETDAEHTDAEHTDAEDTDPGDTPGPGRRRGLRRRRAEAAVPRTDDAGDPADADADADAPRAAGTDQDRAGRRRRAVLPLVPVLGVLLVLLLGGVGYLLVTRPGSSSVATGDYVDALQAARAGIVDVTSFDYLTLDDDITQIQAVTTGDLTQESVDRLNGSRQALTDAQAVVNTEVVGAAVVAADDRTASVYMVIQSTQTSSASQQAQVQRYRIEVDLTKDGGRWLLSGIQGR